MTRQPHLMGATYGIVVNEKNEVLMLQRQNTGYFDGGYCLPAGHIEKGELTFSSIQHELEEEIGIHVIPDDVTLIHILHRMTPSDNGREYFDVCYVIKSRTGEIENKEADKCSGLFWFDIAGLPDYMGQENRLFIETYFQKGDSEITFSELDQRGSGISTK